LLLKALAYLGYVPEKLDCMPMIVFMISIGKEITPDRVP
jgi:hypothetical protein